MALSCFPRGAPVYSGNGACLCTVQSLLCADWQSRTLGGSICSLGGLLSRWLIRRELLGWEALRTLPVHLRHLFVIGQSQPNPNGGREAEPVSIWDTCAKECVSQTQHQHAPVGNPEPEGQLAFKRRVSEVLSLATMDECCEEEKPL